MKEDREAMAKADGYVSAYGAKTWGDLLDEQAYGPVTTEGADMSKANEHEASQELQHVMQMTGDPAATLDPNLDPSRMTRIV